MFDPILEIFAGFFISAIFIPPRHHIILFEATTIIFIMHASSISVMSASVAFDITSTEKKYLDQAVYKLDPSVPWDGWMEYNFNSYDLNCCRELLQSTTHT